MTRDELLDVLRADTNDDPETWHMNAENALLAFINDAEVTAAFHGTNKGCA